MDTADLVVIGGGASAALLTAALFRRARRPLLVSIIEPRSRLGAGRAYGDAFPGNLLNVPAVRMSALADAPGDFVEWLVRRNMHVTDPAAFYAQRRTYADYLTDCMGRALRLSEAEHGISHRLEHLPERAVCLRPDGDSWVVELEAGEAVGAPQVVLALGNLTIPDPPRGLEDLAAEPGYLHDPWRMSPESVDPAAAVALIGSGLTAVDMVQNLIAGGHRGPIRVLSPSGCWPAAHPPARNPAPEPIRSRRLGKVLREIRTRIRRAEARGLDWRDVIDGLREQANALWTGFSEAEKRRFLRHLKGRWSRIRHRMPPDISAHLSAWQRGGVVRIERAPALSARPEAERIRLFTGTHSVLVDRVINCTGPCLEIARSGQPLLRQTLADGLIRPGAAGRGLAADAGGQVFSPTGAPQPGLYAIGPLRQGDLLESTAIPEIRVQARDLAHRLIAEMTVNASGRRGDGLTPAWIR